MNINLHTPKSLKTGSGMATLKQFVLSLFATSVSIALTFGTAAIIDYKAKQKAKREIVKTIIYDFEQTIKAMEEADSVFSDAKRQQLLVAEHPEYFDSLHFSLVHAGAKGSTIQLSDITEKIFSSSIETFVTIGNANFITLVSEFYNARNSYKKMVLDVLNEDIKKNSTTESISAFFSINYGDYAFNNHVFLYDMKNTRNKCMKLMEISEEEMKEFSESKIMDTESENDEEFYKVIRQWQEDVYSIGEAQKKYKTDIKE